MSNESWSVPDPIEEDLKIEDDDDVENEELQGERTREQMREDELERRKRNEIEWMSNPQKLLISQKQLKELMSSGEVVLSGMDLYGRELQMGELVILEDEEGKEIQAEFVSSEKLKHRKNGERVTVRLPKDEK